MWANVSAAELVELYNLADVFAAFAEALLNHWGQGRVVGYSAGTWYGVFLESGEETAAVDGESNENRIEE